MTHICLLLCEQDGRGTREPGEERFGDPGGHYGERHGGNVINVPFGNVIGEDRVASVVVDLIEADDGVGDGREHHGPDQNRPEGPLPIYCPAGVAGGNIAYNIDALEYVEDYYNNPNDEADRVVVDPEEQVEHEDLVDDYEVLMQAEDHESNSSAEVAVVINLESDDEPHVVDLDDEELEIKEDRDDEPHVIDLDDEEPEIKEDQGNGLSLRLRR
ncbi:hypothetical protein FOZ63_026720 [Perkinsus olseni]|uniref:Uncharacterized protein n=1 Tax=Perkinsus olseni TaxID=32597 RepID=A0A7J6TIN1_PEROL|nr:hypothetical protein FOZ63_026720 [Perkinsus olseni]